MESKDFKGLSEAYSQVYSTSEKNENLGEEVTKLPSTINRRRKTSLSKTSSSGRPALGTHDPEKGSYVGKGDIAIGSGRMGTLNPVKSLGRDYKGDKDKVSSEYKKQVKADRRAAAKERSSSGEDRLGKLIRSVQKEELDIFDVVLEYLQTEGYENPEKVMTQLSSEEIASILEATYSTKRG